MNTETNTIAGTTVSRFLVRYLTQVREQVQRPDYILSGQGIALVEAAIRDGFRRQLMHGREFAHLRAAAYDWITEGK
ncbi:MAG: hypothetical protein Q4F65_12040 [Propionibacteriaceae bacterium]|nr:hypothetical protein [Propionibacteriaceae bacterium]